MFTQCPFFKLLFRNRKAVACKMALFYQNPAAGQTIKIIRSDFIHKIAY